MLTRKQHELLIFIDKHLRQTGFSPSFEEMKEALDHLDHGQRDASAHAAMALDSTIKIISNENGWTSGTETGAAN